jgi:predicted nuclease with TOPRIM domain
MGADELALELAALNERLEESHRQRSALFEMTRDIQDNLVRLSARFDTHLDQEREDFLRMEKNLSVLTVGVEDWKTNKARAGGVVLAITSIGAVIGATAEQLWSFLNKLFGHQ